MHSFKKWDSTGREEGENKLAGLYLFIDHEEEHMNILVTKTLYRLESNPKISIRFFFHLSFLLSILTVGCGSMGIRGLTVNSSVLTIYNYFWSSTFYFYGKTSHLTTRSIKHLLKTILMVYSLSYNMAYTILPKRQSNWSQPPAPPPLSCWKADGVGAQGISLLTNSTPFEVTTC